MPEQEAAAKPRRPRSWQEMRDQDIRLLIERTGEDLDTWNARVRESGAEDEAALKNWLDKAGVKGYPADLLVMERFGYPDYLQATPDELIDGQYEDRPALRPILDKLLALIPKVGEVEIQARKTFVALITPRRTFAAIQPTTRTRVDLGLRLTASQAAEGRLEKAPNFGQSSVTHKIALTNEEDVDNVVVDWLKRSYELNV